MTRVLPSWFYRIHKLSPLTHSRTHSLLCGKRTTLVRYLDITASSSSEEERVEIGMKKVGAGLRTLCARVESETSPSTRFSLCGANHVISLSSRSRTHVAHLTPPCSHLFIRLNTRAYPCITHVAGEVVFIRSMEFPNLGQHCALESCKLLDFLPYKCDRCGLSFCAEHRTYEARDNASSTALLCERRLTLIH